MVKQLSLMTRVCSSTITQATGNSMTAVTHRLVGHGVLTEVVSDHVTLDLDRSPVLSSVDFGDGADHLGHDDGVTEVGPDWPICLIHLLFLFIANRASVDSILECPGS